MIIKNLRDVIFKKYYKQVGFNKENIYYPLKRPIKESSTRLVETNMTLTIRKNAVNLIWRKITTKLVKQSKIIQDLKNLETQTLLTETSYYRTSK